MSQNEQDPQPVPRPKLSMKLKKAPKKEPQTLVNVSSDSGVETELNSWKSLGLIEGRLVEHTLHCSNRGAIDPLTGICCKDLSPELILSFQRKEKDFDKYSVSILSQKSSIDLGYLRRDFGEYLSPLIDEKILSISASLPKELKITDEIFFPLEVKVNTYTLKAKKDNPGIIQIWKGFLEKCFLGTTGFVSPSAEFSTLKLLI